MFLVSVVIYCVIIRCGSDNIRFAHQDDADEVHKKPEEGSMTFADGALTGWVKFSGKAPVRIRGNRWGKSYYS